VTVRYVKRGLPHVRTAGDEVEQRVRELLATISERGEPAVRTLSEGFDRWNPSSFRLSDDDVARMTAEVPQRLDEHIRTAADRISRFARAQRDCLSDVHLEIEPGYVAGHRHVPVDSVGAYVAGGRYQLISSALMSIVPAKVAGVPRVVAMIGPEQGRGPSPASVLAATVAGADEIWSLGGVQAMACLAHGILPGLAPVDMIVGAGNDFVAEAKRQLFGRVGIDLLAGPSEILVVADDGADPRTVAVDLLAQAEHGPTSPAVLVTTSADLAEAVTAALEQPLRDWPTAETAGQAWDRYGSIVVADDLVEAARIVDHFAPEHVHVMLQDPWAFAARLHNYGGLFVGCDTTVAFGDKAAGPNHTLPTQRAARFTGGLSVLKYLKTLTYQEATPAGAARVAVAATAIAEAEGMHGHAESSRLRLPAVSQP
jgi:sulfopropanediol 3-dehydrogenase